jgi:hypothetical protein
MNLACPKRFRHSKPRVSFCCVFSPARLSFLRLLLAFLLHLCHVPCDDEKCNLVGFEFESLVYDVVVETVAHHEIAHDVPHQHFELQSVRFVQHEVE